MSTDSASSPGGTAGRGGVQQDPLLGCLALITRLHGAPVAPETLRAGLPLREGRLTPSLFVRAARAQGYAATITKRSLSRLSSLLLPAVLVLEGGDACVLERRAGRRRAVVRLPDAPESSREVALKDLADSYTGYCILAHPAPRADQRMGDGGLPAPVSGRGWFWGTLWRFRGYYVEAALAAVLVNVLALGVALYVMNVYDRVVPNNALETLTVLAIGAGLAIGFEFLARTVRSYFLDTAARKADVLLAARLFGQAMALRMEARPGSAGAFSSHLREFESLRDFCTSATLATLSDLPFVFFFVWVISLIGGPLYVVPLLAVPLVLLVGLIVQLPLAWLMRRHMRESALRHGLLVEAVEGMETLKTLTAEGAVQARFEDYTALTGRSGARARTLSGALVNFALFVQQSVTVLLVVWGVHLIGEGELTVGALIACVILSGRGLAPMAQVAGLMARYQQARAAYFMLDELMQREVERPVGRRFLHRDRFQGALEVSRLTFAYPGQTAPALEQLSLRVEAGEHVAVLGRVGSGKSTLLRLLTGLYRPGEGAVLLDGVDLQQLDPALVRRHVSLVDQTPRLFYGTLRENISLGMPEASDEQILEAARLAGLDQLAARHPAGFDLPIGERGEGLSGGQRQGVALARALLRGPRVLLLDEPTASMDHNTEQAFLANLIRFAKGRTLVTATHKPSVVALAARIVVLEGGRVVMDGPREQVLAQLAGGAAQASAGSGG